MPKMFRACYFMFRACYFIFRASYFAHFSPKWAPFLPKWAPFLPKRGCDTKISSFWLVLLVLACFIKYLTDWFDLFGRNKQDTIWFTGQVRSTNMKESLPCVISHASEWERRHHCNPEQPRVSISSGLCNIEWVTTYWLFCLQITRDE